MATRNDKFKEALSIYFENSNLNIPSLEPLVWNVEVITKNTKENYHQYTFEIPRRIEQYVIDEHHDPSGCLIEKEIVYRCQALPNIEEFEKDFYNYFEPFFIKKGNIVVAYTDLQNIELTANGLHGEIVVLYHKSYLPYPYKNNSVNINYLTDKIRRRDEDIYEMQEYLFEINNNIKKMKKKMIHDNFFHDEYRRRTEKKIRSFYSEKGVYEDCPVCFEKILPEMLYISTCFHYVCLECSPKCNSCPLCREKY
jgi:hypothetical protein